MSEAANPLRISIAVPCYNHAKYLRACLESLQRQTYPPAEVLIADGGSRDGCLDIIDEFARCDDLFRLISRSDAGQADAVQRAFEESTGDVFGFLNSDDFYLDDHALDLVAQRFNEHPTVDLVSFGGWYVGESGERIRPVNLRYHPLDGFHQMRRRTAVLQPATFWRRRVQELHPLRTELSFVFDAWFFYEAYLDHKWHVEKTPIAAYRLHETNKSRGVRVDRVAELAQLEAFKFGARSWRARYLLRVANLVATFSRLGRIGECLVRVLYIGVNSLSFATAYRIPAI